MRNRFLAAAGSGAAALTLLFSPSAPAATEFGSDCVGNFEIAGPVVATSASVDPASTLPLTAPTGGIVTQWRTNIEAGVVLPGLVDEQLVLLRPAEVPKRFTVVATSELEPVAAGANVFPTRIPVQTGDRLALAGNATLACLTAKPLDRILVDNPDVSVGSTIDILGEAPNARVPISVLIEPDADNDGFGDETQDLCPQSAAFQTACPVVAVSALAAPGKGSVTVYVATNRDAPVTVAGSVSLGKGRKASLTAAPQTLAAGQVARFILKFPKRVKARLGKLAANRKLTLQISASAPNLTGQVSSHTLSAKLKGQGHPAARQSRRSGPVA